MFNIIICKENQVFMKIKHISRSTLKDEGQFYSFIICKATNASLYEKFPYHVVTLNSQIHSPQENDKDSKSFEYNYSFDSVNYSINGRKVILGEGNWIKNLLTKKQNQLLQTYQVINYESIEEKQQLRFYFYSYKDKAFLPIMPKYIILHDCIIFELPQPSQNICFKTINCPQILSLLKLVQQKQIAMSLDIYTFSCEYAIMSDIHFMISFVRDYKSTSSYFKETGDKHYYHFIQKPILQILNRLYPFSNL